jgi:L-asparaginase
MDTIHFLLTGGTIDSYFDTKADANKPFTDSVIPRYLNRIDIPQDTFYTKICMKDSRELGQKDFENLLNEINLSPYKKLIVTHGTFTMPDTARLIKENTNRQDQVVIFTGSMIPLEDFVFSDAGFNLGFSIAKLDQLEPGIYVCMNGRIFYPEEILKLLHEGRFESIRKNPHDQTMLLQKTVHFISTGGTIDSEFSGSLDKVTALKESVVYDYISRLNLAVKTSFTGVCSKDSRDLSEADIDKIIDSIESSPHKRLVVTHGTYEMEKTIEILRAKQKRLDQVIVFTGSQLPLKGFAPSDAPFNLGYTMASIEHLEPGIYKSIGGEIS